MRGPKRGLLVLLLVVLITPIPGDAALPINATVNAPLLPGLIAKVKPLLYLRCALPPHCSPGPLSPTPAAADDQDSEYATCRGGSRATHRYRPSEGYRGTWEHTQSYACTAKMLYIYQTSTLSDNYNLVDDLGEFETNEPYITGPKHNGVCDPDCAQYWYMYTVVEVALPDNPSLYWPESLPPNCWFKDTERRVVHCEADKGFRIGP